MRSLSETDEMFGLAKEYFEAGKYTQAEPILQQLLLKQTKNPEIYQMLATIAYDKGQFNKAIKIFKRALEIDPSYTDASLGLSIILNDLGRYDEGKEIFAKAQKFLDQKKGDRDPWLDEKIASKHEELADLYFQYRRYPEALEQLYKALKLSNRKSEIRLRVAETLSQSNQVDKAIKELKSLIHEFPQFIPAKLKLGSLLYNIDQVAEAVDQWEGILLRDPDHPEANRYLKMAQATGMTSLSP